MGVNGAARPARHGGGRLVPQPRLPRRRRAARGADRARLPNRRTAAPQEGRDDLARFGLLHLAVALSYAKTGRAGDAWWHWDEADRAARALPPGYAHPWLIFGRPMADAYTITMHADPMRPADAVAAADDFDMAAIPSATRRSFHLAETARAYSLRREPVATVHLLHRSLEESPDTTRFSLFARSALGELRKVGLRGDRDAQGGAGEGQAAGDPPRSVAVHPDGEGRRRA